MRDRDPQTCNLTRHSSLCGAGEVQSLALELARRGHRVFEPLQARRFLDGQVKELAQQIRAAGHPSANSAGN